MLPSDNQTKNDWLSILFKLLHDLLFLLLLFFSLALLAEGMLPGIVTNHFSLARIAILVAGNVFLITFLGRRLDAPVFSGTTDKKMIWAISFLGIILVLNGLLKINLLLILFFALLAAGTAYLTYLVVLREE